MELDVRNVPKRNERMINNMWCSIIGIILVFVGTTLSLWCIMTNDTKKAGTWRGVKEQGEDAKREKTWVIVGMCFILIGSILQIIGACQ